MTTLRCCATVVCTVAAAMMIPVTAAHADAVLDWNAHAANAIVTVGGQNPPRAFIRLAMVHLAIYDAVNAIEGQPLQKLCDNRTSPVRPLPTPPWQRRRTTSSWRSFPPRPPTSARNTRRPSPRCQTMRTANGVAVGEQAAAAILAARVNDGRDATVTYVPGTGPGVWAPTPPAFREGWHRRRHSFNRLPCSRLRSSDRTHRPVSRAGDGFLTTTRSRRWVRWSGALVTRNRPISDASGSDNTPLQWNRAWRALSVGSFLRPAENARYFAMLRQYPPTR